LISPLLKATIPPNDKAIPPNTQYIGKAVAIPVVIAIYEAVKAPKKLPPA